MKKPILQFITTLGIAALLVSVSVVSAWNPPVRKTGTGIVTSPTSDNARSVAASINLGLFDQIKQGGILLPMVKQKFVSPKSFFKKTLLPGTDTSVYIGGASYSDPSFTSSFPGNRDVPMTIDLTGRNNPTGAIQFKTGEVCPQTTKLINTSAPAFEFWNTAKNTNADVLAKGIRLEGGNPAQGKILISVDDKGRAVWATPKLAANGRDIIFDTYNDSPVGICGTPAPADVCPNIALVQTSIPVGMIKDANGDCVTPTPVCPTGQAWDTAQSACTCSAGVRAGQLPATFNQVGKIITYIDSVNQNPGGSGAPIVPYYVVMDQFRTAGGGPGDDCRVVAWDAACPLIDLNTMRDEEGLPAASVTLGGTTYNLQVPAGNSWEIDHALNDQCTMHRAADVSDSQLYMYKIER